MECLRRKYALPQLLLFGLYPCIREICGEFFVLATTYTFRTAPAPSGNSSSNSRADRLNTG
jgi:hypothetical protein